MARRDLPVITGWVQYVTGKPDVRGGNGRVGAAVLNPRDAYADVPILAAPPWGHEVSAYFFFGGVSSGAYTVGSLALLSGDRWAALGRIGHVVSLCALLPCPVLLIADLGRSTRFHHMLRIFKPSSPMNLGAWALLIHSGFVGVSFLQAFAQVETMPLIGVLIRSLPERLPAAAGLPSALALGGYTGVLLGTTSVPVWYTSPLLGALFMASSLTAGVGAITLALALKGDDLDAMTVLRPLSVQFGFAELGLLSGYLATSGKSTKALLTGRVALQLAGVVAMTSLAIALDAAPTRTGAGARLLGLAAGAASLAGGALLRWAVVRAGAPSAKDREATLEAMSPSTRSRGWVP